MGYINKIETLTPQNQINQNDFVELLKDNFLQDETSKRLANISGKRTGISTRHSVLDFFNPNHEIDLKKFIELDIERKNQLFFQYSLNLIDQIISKSSFDLNKITHIISISCTGIKAPGLEIEIIKKYKLNTEITRYSINFMGCYAAIHGLKLAKEICSNHPDAKILIVDVELCTLHFTGKNTIDDLNSSLLFGDGAALALVSNEEKGFKIESSFSDIFLSGIDEMAWYPTSHFFKMKLSEKIPDLIKEYLDLNKIKLIQKFNFNTDQKINGLIHPGSLKILQIVKNSFSEFEFDMENSFEVLKNFGNMSSVTLFFILEKTFKKPNENYFLMGFGPGLSIETLKLC